MSTDRPLQTYCLEGIEFRVCKTSGGHDCEIVLRHGDANLWQASADQIARLREVLQQAEFFARFQQQLNQRWCPTCGESSPV